MFLMQPLRRKRPMVFRLGVPIFLLSLALIPLFVVLVNDNKKTEPIKARITVEEIVNRVETNIRRDAHQRPAFSPAEIGQVLLPGDGVKTFPGSEARVDITIGALTRITRTRPNTLWRIGQFGIDNGTIIELTQGEIFLIEDTSGQKLPPVKIVTPAGTASPRGTWMSVAYDPERGVAELRCYQGECAIQNAAGTQWLTGGQKNTTTGQSPPATPQSMTQVDMLEFVQLK